MDPVQDVLVLRDVLIPGGRVCDLTLADGKVTHLGSSGSADRICKCSDLMVLPAGVDMHVHMRDGSQAYKEDWESGTKSALAGGVTVVVDQPNTIPQITTPELLADRVALAGEHSFCHFGINAGVTPEADLTGMAKGGAMAFGETFAGPSSYGEALSRTDLHSALTRIEELDGLATLHAEMVREGDDTSLPAHDRLRSISGERAAVQMIMELAPPDLRLHFCHISAADTVSDIRSTGNATIEVTPHHLFLSLESFQSENSYGKVNPSLRTEKERKRLWGCWEQIDVVASDHAPHTVSEKSSSFEKAPSGIPGVGTMIPLLMTEVIKGRISLADVIYKTSVNPARILGILPAGYEPGMRADFALYPKEGTPIHADEIFSKAGWTPYEGQIGVFPELVLMSGEVAFDNGTCIRTDPRWMQGRGYIP
ncbi:MAG: dihydroorotase [Methanospirillum sp.]|uniref:dihydroorotase n=1 Tax=Methanospirillum sp. TaxID=45200 RepID=UPI00236D7B90|nr:dihydroorotase [Methanospirillum sp.]MDD1729467.1 dihydroorotase [Methanospirillum sp.]